MTLLGAFISLLGLFILVAQGNLWAIFSQGLNYGDALIFVASISYALYSVLLTRWILPLSLWQSLYMQSVWAVFLYLPIYLFAPSEILVFNIQNISLILYAGIIASVIAPFLWMQKHKAPGSNTHQYFYVFVSSNYCPPRNKHFARRTLFLSYYRRPTDANWRCSMSNKARFFTKTGSDKPIYLTFVVEDSKSLPIR